MPHPVFISYGCKTSCELAVALHRELGGEGGLAFLDTSNVEVGEHFAKVLVDAKVVVFDTYFNRWWGNCLRMARTLLREHENRIFSG